MNNNEIKTTHEIKKLAEEYREECPYLNNKTFKELLKHATEEHKEVLEYLKDK